MEFLASFYYWFFTFPLSGVSVLLYMVASKVIAYLYKVTDAFKLVGEDRSVSYVYVTL